MYMKKLSTLKMVNLVVLCILTAISVCLLFNSDVKNFVFSNTAATILFGVVWILLIASFVFLLLDFMVVGNLKLNYHNLYEIAYSDPLSGIPNRFSCDVLIEKYADQELPASVGCVVIDLTNLPSINQKFSHKVGNQLLSEFSSILSSAAASLCFVGRNGGNKFLAIFEECDEEKISFFLKRVDQKVVQHNALAEDTKIEYAYGTAMNKDENIAQITKLIALANSRVYED